METMISLNTTTTGNPVMDYTFTTADQYALLIIAYVSMTINFMLLLMVVVKLTWTALETCHVTSVTSSLAKSQQKISLLITGEVVNILLIVTTVYTCVTLHWPRDYVIHPSNLPPTSLLFITCVNLGRYLFRSGVAIHCRFTDRGIVLKLIHHMVVIWLLSVVLVEKYCFWYAIMAVVMEMDHVISTMHRLMKLINNSHWLRVRQKFAYVELAARIVFRIVLSFILLLLYSRNDYMKKHEVKTWLTQLTDYVCLVPLFGFQIWHVFAQIKYMDKLKKAAAVNDVENSPEKRPVVMNSQSEKLNITSPLKVANQMPAKLAPPPANLDKKLQMVKNDLAVPKKESTSNAVLLNKTSNVNTDVREKNGGKSCNKTLIGRSNQIQTDVVDMLDEVKK